MEHALTQERETRTTISLSFDEFQLVDEPFNLPIGIDQGEPGKHFIFVPLQPGSETFDIAEAARLNLLYPILELVGAATTDNLPKRLGKAMQYR
jgi:hypothetical protein